MLNVNRMSRINAGRGTTRSAKITKTNAGAPTL
jgi:hypothetical protein